MMNVYQKLQSCRVALQEAKIKKSGRNRHAGYEYYELSDFLPTINKLFLEHGLFSHVSFTNEMATLTVINCEKPDEQIVFTSPMERAELRGVQPIQNVGAVQTYQRRYLYLMALEITEGDALDAMHDPNAQPHGEPARRNGNGAPRGASEPSPKAAHNGESRISDAQRRRLFALAQEAGVDNDELRSLIKGMTGQESTASLTREDYNAICDMLESRAQGMLV